MARATPDLHGVLVVDKARGPTSHDVVNMARRALGTRAVGHTGTLDPMASGVLVLVVGEATKLSNLLGAGDKAYDAVLALGAETTSLDAEGEVVCERPVPSFRESDALAAARRFLGVTEQQVPKVSAVKVGGQRLYARARSAEVIVPPSRAVRLDAVTVRRLDDHHLAISLRCGKGFYVRSFARDLAHALGTVGHLTELRRVENAGFDLGAAVPADLLRAAAAQEACAREAVRASLVPLLAVCRRLPHLALDARGSDDARHGRRVTLDSERAQALAHLRGGPCVALSEEGGPLAIVEVGDDSLRVMRGFRQS